MLNDELQKPRRRKVGFPNRAGYTARVRFRYRDLRDVINDARETAALKSVRQRNCLDHDPKRAVLSALFLGRGLLFARH
jgi:hypothetical protein